MNAKITIYMTNDKVRAMCIKRDYCTMCDNEEYSNLLDRCNMAVDANDIIRIAKQIAEYTDIDRIGRITGFLDDEIIENIAFNLLNECTYSTIEID
jgi:hypothetical protein